MVTQVFKPKINETLAAEREGRIKATDKEGFRKKKEMIQNSPYKDYFKESIKNIAKPKVESSPSLPNINNDLKSKNDTPFKEDQGPLNSSPS